MAAGNVRRAISSCLSYRDGAAAVSAAVDAVGWATVIEHAQVLRLGPAVVSRLRDKRAVPLIPAVTLPNGMQTVTASLEQIWRNHVARRDVLRDRLTELVAAVNGAGLRPILLKGARSLAAGDPAWRTMRDLDLLLPGNEATEAYRVALDLGYRPDEKSTEKASGHHLPPLFRDDMPGWIEIHQRAATHRAEQPVPTGLLQTMTTEVAIGTASALILTPPAHTMHALVHHHIGHRGDKNGEIDLKGLFEFCTDLALMTKPELAELVALAERHPRLVAALELWVAAADGAFGSAVVPPLTVGADAVARAVSIERRANEPRRRNRGFVEEVAFACAKKRLSNQPGGGTAWGRFALCARVVSSMLTPMS